MATKPSYEQFRKCVLESYQEAIEDFGFQEIPRSSGKFTNEYMVRLTNETTLIEVEGIHYGFGAWAKLYKAVPKTESNSFLPTNRLLSSRMGTIRSVKRKEPVGQLREVQEDAEAILKHARDVLEGDFTAIDLVAEQILAEEQERKRNAPSPEQRAANSACSEAGHAFKNEEHAKVVELLSPHLEYLPVSQRKRYEISLKLM